MMESWTVAQNRFYKKYRFSPDAIGSISNFPEHHIKKKYEYFFQKLG
jgi:hypothetical protein